MTYFGVLVLALLVLIGGRAVWRRWFQKTKEEKPSRFGLVRGFRYGFTILRHPFEGYYRMRREGQGTFSGAAAILGLAMLLQVVDSQFGSFLYNRQDLSNNNLLYALLELAVPVALFTVSNWCLTTLMEGEGRMQDIFKAVCYALLPYVLVSGLTFCLGHVLNYDERMFISVLHSLGLFWMVFLIFAGMLSIHQYPAGKTILSILGTLVVMAIIIFIAALFFALLQQLISFVYSIYQELSLRM